jgi:hypothetical protein
LRQKSQCNSTLFFIAAAGAADRCNEALKVLFGSKLGIGDVGIGHTGCT